MKLSTGKIIVLLSVVVLAVFAFAVNKKINPSKEERTVSESPINTYEVTANNGEFIPNNFMTEVLVDFEISVTALDRDYEFRVDGYPRLSYDIAKGETKVIRVSALGAGDYPYTCGDGCTGTITVIPMDDGGEAN